MKICIIARRLQSAGRTESRFSAFTRVTHLASRRFYQEDSISRNVEYPAAPSTGSSITPWICQVTCFFLRSSLGLLYTSTRRSLLVVLANRSFRSSLSHVSIRFNSSRGVKGCTRVIRSTYRLADIAELISTTRNSVSFSAIIEDTIIDQEWFERRSATPRAENGSSVSFWRDQRQLDRGD